MEFVNVKFGIEFHRNVSDVRSDSDSDIDDSIQATMNDNNRTNVWDLEVNDSMESVSEDLNDETMEEQIEEIFALTIKEMP